MLLSGTPLPGWKTIAQGYSKVANSAIVNGRSALGTFARPNWPSEAGGWLGPDAPQAPTRSNSAAVAENRLIALPNSQACHGDPTRLRASLDAPISASSPRHRN
jgi:hypothetical protein